MFLCTLRPNLGPRGPALPLAERLRALWGAGPFIVVVAATIGGIYAGVFTVNEAAAVGALLTMVHALWRRTLGLAQLTDALLQTVRTTAMVFLILIGAHIFSPFLAMSRIPSDLAGLLVDYKLGAMTVLAILLVAYVVMGMFLEGFAMMVLTVPIVLPIITALGVDPIWFGIFMVIVLEMGLISPPVGINVFVVKGIAEDVPMGKIFAGIMPFWFAMVVCVVLLTMFPEIVMVVPNTMMGR
jgi:tripartite ATP-independent transporter DctM subunit